MAKRLPKKLAEELRKKLLREEKKLVREIENLKADDPFADPDYVSDNAAIDTDVREQMGHATIQAQIQSLQKKLDRVRSAFKKMAKGKYGTCENCGRLIKTARLKLIPEVNYCLDCQKRLVK